MGNETVRFPQVTGKAIAELSVYDDPMFGREVLIRFTDGIQLSIVVGVRQSIDARYCLEEIPNSPLFIRQDSGVVGT